MKTYKLEITYDNGVYFTFICCAFTKWGAKRQAPRFNKCKIVSCIVTKI